MAAHRYWRATAFEAYGAGDLELSEFHLLASGSRVDAPATLTASVAPDVSGVIANLQDDVLTTAARWSAQGVKGLTLQWDFGGSIADVDDIRLAGDSELRFPLIIKIQWSDDATVWVDALVVSGVRWPGSQAKTSSGGDTDPHLSSVAVMLHFDEGAGSTAISDSSNAPRTVTAYGSAQISLDMRYGSGGLILSGAGSYLSVAGIASSALSTAFTVEMFIKPASLASPDNALLHINAGSNNGLHLHQNLQTLIVDNGLVSTPASGSVFPYTTQWYHVAVVLSGGVITGYVDGVAVLSHAVQSYGSPSQLLVGRFKDGAVINDFSGKIDELRFTPGVARYTSGFTPPIFSRPEISGHTVAGRVTDGGGAGGAGGGPIITYGIPQITNPDYLSIESGSVKDQITGVLGKGIGRVKGTVATKGSPNQPVHRKVRLIRERDGVVIREVWSNAATGEYDFQWVDEAQTFTVVSYDHLHNYRAVIADNLTPELMP